MTFYIITSLVFIFLCGYFYYVFKYMKSIGNIDEESETEDRFLFFDEDRKRPNFFRRMNLHWEYNWSFKHKEIWRGLKSIKSWFYIIWNDRDWDRHYMFIMLKHKIENMAIYHEDRKYYEGWDKNVKWMRVSCKLIDRINNDYYELEHMDYMDRKMWGIPIKDSDMSRIEFETIWEDLDSYFNLYPLQYELVRSRYPNLDPINPLDKEKIATYIATTNQKRCVDLLYKIMSEHSMSWWD